MAPDINSLVEEVIVKVRYQNEGTKEMVTDIREKTRTMAQDMGNGFRKITTSSQKFGKDGAVGPEMIRERLMKMGERFRMEYLGMMFGFMLLSRVINNFGRDTLSTFLKISEAVTEQGRALLALQANWIWLKFEIGSAIATALQPLIPLFIDLIQKIGDFIQKHPKLVGWIIILTTAFLTLGFIIFNALLFFNALSIFMEGPLMASISGLLGPEALGGLVSVLGWIALAVAVLALFWYTNFGGMRDFFGEIWQGIKDTFGSVWEDIKTIFTGVWGFITSLLQGDWDKAMKHLGDALFAALRVILKSMTFIGWALINLFFWVVNVIKDLIIKVIGNGIIWVVEGIINFIINKVNFFIRMFNSVAGALGLGRLEMIKNVDFGGAMEAMKSFADKTDIKPISSESLKTINQTIDVVINADTLSGDNLTEIATKVGQAIADQIQSKT